VTVLHRIAFGASCCERLLPNYRKFTDVEKWGDYKFLEDTLEEIWSFIYGKQFKSDKIDMLIKMCYKVTPDSEEFDSIYTSFAIDAGGAVHEMLKCCLYNESKHVVDVACFARDTVDMYIQERDNMDYSDIDFELKILNDKLMQNKLKKQLNDLELLNNNHQLNSQFLEAFRAMVRGKSNIRI
jgi:hypothetical protein